MRNGYVLDTLTSVDICETVSTRRKANRKHKGVIYRKNFKIPSFIKVIDKLFTLGQNKKTNVMS